VRPIRAWRSPCGKITLGLLEPLTLRIATWERIIAVVREQIVAENAAGIEAEKEK
jgi:hypothetical protein